MAESDKLELLKILNRHAVTLIEDDVYGDIYFGRDHPKPFIALDNGSNTIYCSSFSKTLAPGYRIGWLAAGAHAQQLMERKLAFSLCSPVLPQVALADFLESGAYEVHLRVPSSKASRRIQKSVNPQEDLYSGSNCRGDLVRVLSLMKRSRKASASHREMRFRRAVGFAIAYG
jgi:DNA-binding transcriptional MocR family regulator